jgi:hypothetical protein
MRESRKELPMVFSAKADPIVADVRKVKEQLAAQFNHDVVAMLRDAQKREKRSGHKLVSLARTENKLAHAE